MSQLEELLNQTKTNEEALQSIDTGGSTPKDPNDPLNWKLKEGEQIVRILPSLDGIPLKELHIHWKIGKGPFLCPKKMFGEDCAACDLGWDLWSEAGDDKKLKEKAKMFLPDQRYAALIIARALEEADIEAHGKPIARVWDFNWTTYKDIRSWMAKGS